MTPHEQEQMDYMAFVTAMRMLKSKNSGHFRDAAIYMMETEGFYVYDSSAAVALDKLQAVYGALGQHYTVSSPARYHGRVPADMSV